MHRFLATVLLAAPAAFAATPADLLATYEAQAKRADAAFTGFSAARGAALYRGSGSTTCSSCHSSDPRQPGRHARTGKSIAPLAPTANPGRLTDPAKAEKWFGRNCRDVLARDCTAQEKGDFVRFLMDAN
ncbi:MAG: DUF1924 domain-containing protein [Betaproteobacteria bacterium]|jgi:mono/diheme cytochrome c family protein|nr:DUF1924 domain-containing protein [Betaproteobacteria bacterium]